MSTVHNVRKQRQRASAPAGAGEPGGRPEPWPWPQARCQRAWRLWLLVSVVATAGHFLLPTGVAGDALFMLIGASTVSAVLVGILAHRPVRSLPWCLLALGLLMMVAGDAVVFAYVNVLRVEYPFPSAADALYVGAYPVVAAGLLMMRSRDLVRGGIGLIDPLIVAAGVGMVYWAFLLGPVADAHGLSLLQRVVDAAYPLADVLVFVVLVRFLLAPFGKEGRPPASYLVTAALALLLAADVANDALALSGVYEVVAGVYEPAALANAAWLLSYALFGAAALHPSMGRLSEPTPLAEAKLTRGRLVMLAGTALLAPSVLAAQAVLGQKVEVLAIVGISVVLFLLTTARMNIMIGERENLEESLRHQASHDPLTGLPNRTLFCDRLEQALSRGQRRGDGLAVLFLDLDNFKVINDSLGHAAGDRLLVETARRLHRALRTEDTAARFGGDEFAILLEDVADAEDAVSSAERIAEALRSPLLLGDQEVSVGASIGIAVGRPDDGLGGEPENLLRDADAAMYGAKAGGKAGHKVFHPSMKGKARSHLELASELRRAVERGEFEVYYQPKVLLGTGRIVGVEALVRWRHPDRGLVYPEEFVPVAEETGLIVPVGRWVLEKACRQAKRWHEASPDNPPLTVAVNLSPKQLRWSCLVEEVAGALRATGLDPGALELEITESVAMYDDPYITTTLYELKDLGVRLSVDDFGTGYSSLSYLKRFPIDSLKIDRSIVEGLDRDPRNNAIASAAVTVAHELGQQVVAEGVETAEHARRLQLLGCDVGQGYYFCEPGTVEAFTALLSLGPE